MKSFPPLQKYKMDGHDTMVLAGAEYGSGSARDWAAKGTVLLVSWDIFQYPCVRSFIKMDKYVAEQYSFVALYHL